MLEFSTKFQVEGTGSDASLSLIRNTNNTANPYLLFAKSRGSSNGSNTAVQNGDYLGAIYFSGADGTDINSSGAEIHCRVDGTPGSNDMPGRVVLHYSGWCVFSDGASQNRFKWLGSYKRQSTEVPFCKQPCFCADWIIDSGSNSG